MQGEVTREQETGTERYQLLSVLARGGQGDVWRARDTETDRLVALKLLNEAGARNADAVERLRRERAALLALEDTCAVRVIEGPTVHAGAPCIALELLDGVDLESRLSELEAKGTRLSFSEVAQVLEPLVQTLHKAHGLGIVHRDLKPANVFLLRDGEVRLIDFGFARLEFEARMTAFGVVMGSPCYIAPEVWQGHANTSGVSVDIYSLAVMAYRMLGGHPPFETESLVDMREKATSAPRPSLHALRPDLSPAVDQWVARALAVDPQKRYQSLRVMWEALCEAVEQPKPSSWSEIPRAVAAGLHPRRVAEALRRAGAVLWGRSSPPDVQRSVAPESAQAFARPVPPRRPKPSSLPEPAAPESEPMPISVIPISGAPRSSARVQASRSHANTAANIHERSQRRKKSRRRRANKQVRKARQARRRARGKAGGK